jgi:tRNA-guanine transglycosylase
MSDFFKVLHRSKKSKARLGEIKTAHGVIKTPSFVAVGTKGTVKSILPGLLKEIGTQAAFVNTYHLLIHPGAEVIEKAGGIHRYAGLDLPLMSDSGGFQVFSLARNKMLRHQVFLAPVGPPPLRGASQVEKKLESQETQEKPAIVKISEDGVKFRSTFDGKVIELTPEKSIAYQKMIGADLLMAFDECIPYGVSYQYTKEATERTHRWLERSISEFKKSQAPNSQAKPDHASRDKFQTNNKKQCLYGIIQGGVFEDLRKESAKFVVAQNTDGVAIGGVSVGESKKEMRDQVGWVADYLPADRPVHLLGVGHFDDILDLVSCGIDTFDCVEPTRLARMGNLYQVKSEKFKVESLKIEKIDIPKGIYREDFSKVDESCDCYVCRSFTKSYLHHLFKNRELLAYTLATYHNLWVMERFFEKVREVIAKDQV